MEHHPMGLLKVLSYQYKQSIYNLELRKKSDIATYIASFNLCMLSPGLHQQILSFSHSEEKNI